MIQALLQNILQYKNLDLMPNNKKYNLMQLNNQLLDEINKMKIRLNNEQYNMASIEYKRIIKNIDISFLRKLMFELQITFKTENNFFIDFSIDDDDFNLEQNILLRKLINHNKMRNLIKFFVLKKYCRLNNNDSEKKILIATLIDTISNAKIEEKSKYLTISALEYIIRGSEKKGLYGGGDELNFNNIFIVCIGLYFYDNDRIRNLCYEIILKQNPINVARGINNRLESVAQSDYPYKILLSPAIIKDKVEKYKDVYSTRLSKLHERMDSVDFEVFAKMVKPLEANPELCNPQNVLLLATPFYIAKLKMDGKSIETDSNIKKLLEDVYQPIKDDKQLIEDLKQAFTTNNESTDYLNDSDDSEIFIPAEELKEINTISLPVDLAPVEPVPTTTSWFNHR
jgi:hypothetical protein